MARFPNFIIIGAGKCGTTSLHDYLNQHPEIYLCPKKETFFFINSGARENHRQWGSVTTLEEYLALFKNAPETSILGEISTNYYAYPESAELIYNAIPDVKIIAILRDPSDRAFSSYQMFVRNGHEQREFHEVVALNEKYINRGFYYQQLQPFFATFKPDQIKILLFDDLVKNPRAFLKELFEFVGVNSDFVPDITKRGREGGLPKRAWWHKLLTKQNPVRTAIALLLKLIVPLEKRQQLREKLVKRNISSQKMDVGIRSQLIDIYRDDINNLQGLIKRDLSSWLS
jgi:hypothetical protein